MSIIIDGSNGISDVDGSASTPAIRGTDANTGIFFPAADTIAFAEGGTEVMRIDSAGNVGIGTTNPTKKLFVSDSTFGSVGVYRDLDVTSVGAAGQFIEIGARNGSTFTPGAAVVGVLDNPATTGYLRFDTRSGSALAERMRITSGGDLLVSQTTQTSNEKFGVTQSSTSATSARFYASSTNFTNDVVQISCARSGATTEYNAMTVFDNNTTLKMLIRANGNLLNANNSYGSLSDSKLKENIVDATPKLEKLNQVRIVNYNLIGQDQKQIGVIAQEVEKIFPSLVEETPDKDAEGNNLGTTTKSVKYSVFVPMLIKAIQEQQAQIEELKAEVQALKALQI